MEKKIKANNFIKIVFKCRRERILSYLSDGGFEGAVMFTPENIFYFTGFWGESIAICTHDGVKLFVPQLEVSRAETESFDCEIFQTERGEDSSKSLYPYLSYSKFCSDCNDFKSIDSIHKKISEKNFICDSQPFMDIRSIKDENEIEMIKKSSEIIDKLYQVCVEEIKVNLSEKELQAK
ncbi:MAG TPA: aminopeptidase P family N-terminal domain-containing protein, partial [Nitrososphaeraceae archaeon]|nr:aminopeptidase P family N-terminal domain-containing protein [Nitrososphaeraceae archaeon]